MQKEMENESSYDIKKEFERIESGKVHEENIRKMVEGYISSIRGRAQKKVMSELAKHHPQKTSTEIGFFQHDTDAFLGSYNGNIHPKVRCDIAKHWLDKEFEKNGIPLRMRCALVDTDPTTYYIDAVRRKQSEK